MRSVGTGFLVAATAAAAGFLVVPRMILGAPLEPVMGFVQKIFYFHVPCATMLFLSTFTCAGGSIAYLFKGSEAGDRVALPFRSGRDRLQQRHVTYEEIPSLLIHYSRFPPGPQLFIHALPRGRHERAQIGL